MNKSTIILLIFMQPVIIVLLVLLFILALIFIPLFSFLGIKSPKFKKEIKPVHSKSAEFFDFIPVK